MADAPFQLLGRTPFAGTGRVADYFGPPVDLSYLTAGRPDFIPDDGNYNSDLDVPSLLNQGVPFEQAQQLQGLRARLHEQAARERARVDAQGAITELSQIDPSRETFAKDLLGIFRKYPNARRSKDFVDQVEMIGQFSRMMPQKQEVKMFDLSEIKDPEVRAVAIQEKWDTLPENQGQIRAYDALHRKAQKLDLVKAGYSPEQIAEMEKTGGLTDVGVLHAMNQIKAAQQQKPERTLQPEAARYISEQMLKSREEKDRLATPQGKLTYLQQKYANGDTNKSSFTKAQWDEAYQAAQQPNQYDQAIQLYMQMLGQTPTGVSSQSTEPVWPNRKLSDELEPLPLIGTEEELKKLPSGTRFRTPEGRTGTKK